LLIIDRFLSYYSQPVKDQNPLSQISIESQNGRTTVEFIRKILIQSSFDNDLFYDLSKCSYATVATGSLIGSNLMKHQFTPKFANKCIDFISTIYRNAKADSFNEESFFARTTIDRQFTDDLNNPNSAQYKALDQEIKNYVIILRIYLKITPFY
jgi:hypothetical protein